MVSILSSLHVLEQDTESQISPDKRSVSRWSSSQTEWMKVTHDNYFIDLLIRVYDVGPVDL